MCNRTDRNPFFLFFSPGEVFVKDRVEVVVVGAWVLFELTLKSGVGVIHAFGIVVSGISTLELEYWNWNRILHRNETRRRAEDK